jgi:hypothetical protein
MEIKKRNKIDCHMFCTIKANWRAVIWLTDNLINRAAAQAGLK